MTDINVDLEAILQSKITFNIDLQSTEEVLEAMTAAIRADRGEREIKKRAGSMPVELLHRDDYEALKEVANHIKKLKKKLDKRIQEYDIGSPERKYVMGERDGLSRLLKFINRDK